MEAAAEILKLADDFHIPVATTLRAKGLVPEDHELSLGCVGLYGSNAANKHLRSEVDVLLVVGASLSEFTTHAWDESFQPSRALIQIDVDPWEIGKNYRAEIGMLGSAQDALRQLLEEMAGERGGSDFRSAIRRKIMELKKERQYFADPKNGANDLPLKPQRLMKLLREALPANTIVFADIGNTLPWAEPLPIPSGWHIDTCSSLASMGYAVSASIGGQLAVPDRQVVCFCGDGDFQMQAMEVVTAVNYNIPVKWFILNNSELAMVADLQDILFKGRRIASEFINPDFAASPGDGAVGLRITSRRDWAVIREALTNGRPTVVDIPIDPTEVPPFDARAEAITRAWGTSAPLLKKLKMIPQLLKRM